MPRLGGVRSEADSTEEVDEVDEMLDADSPRVCGCERDVSGVLRRVRGVPALLCLESPVFASEGRDWERLLSGCFGRNHPLYSACFRIRSSCSAACFLL